MGKETEMKLILNLLLHLFMDFSKKEIAAKMEVKNCSNRETEKETTEFDGHSIGKDALR